MILAPSHWERGRIKWDTAMVAGATPSTENDGFWLEGDDPSGTPFVTIADMSRRERVSATTKSLSSDGLNSRSMPIGQPGTLLFAMYASVGEVAFLDITATWNQALLGVTPHPGKADSRFLRYVLLDMRDDLLRDVRSNTQSNLNARQVGDIWFQRPPLSEQRAIADYLDRETARIDTLIEEQQRLVGLLRERRDGVVTKTFLNSTSNERALKFAVDSVTVGIVVQPSRWYVDAGVPALRGVNVKPGSISRADLVNISEEGHAAHSKSQLRSGDVVVVRTGQAGAAAKIPDELDGANAIDILIVRPGQRVDPDFLVWYLNSPLAASRIEHGSVGALQGHFNVSALRELLVPDVSLAEQRRIVAHLDEQIARIDTTIAETERFIELARERRAALITAAVTGQVDVREMV